MTPETPSRGVRLKRYAALAAGVVLLLMFLYRWVPTVHHQGTIQRVYEKMGEFRAEVVTDEGEVLVFTNEEMRFPYLKFNTADMQANLDRYQREGDIVRVSTWGVRSAFLSTFPNIVALERIAAGEDVRKARSERIADAVMGELRARQLVPAGTEEELREVLRAVIDKSQSSGR